jgi:AraC family transcriptional regulator
LKAAAARHYHARMQKVLDHIDRHLDGDLSIETLSGVAAFSKYHFHRQFFELFGICVHRYVQLVRLKHASLCIAFREDYPITQIALNCGYEGPEAFSRAFKQRLGQTPTGFRKQPQWIPWRSALEPIDKTRKMHMKMKLSTDQVRIVDFPATRVAILEHRGDPALFGDTVKRFIAWRKLTGLTPDRSATFSILHTDPEITAPEDYRHQLCAAMESPVAENEAGVFEGLIPAGRCAELRVDGYYGKNLKPAFSFLYSEWLPGSGEQLRDFPIFVQRLNFSPEIPPDEKATLIFLPLR